jgi:hypothetical protein
MRLYRLSLTGALLCYFAYPTFADSTVYNNLTPNNMMAMASRPSSAGKIEIEAADDFVLTQDTTLSSGSFVGLLAGGTGSTSIAKVNVEIYRVFPLDSQVPPSGRVPSRANSPSDVAFSEAESTANQLTFSTTLLNNTFTASNHVLNGIFPKPNQNTLGEGPITGQETQINFSLSSGMTLPAGHYFFVPQVELTNDSNFFWLSASRPVSGAGTTPFPSGTTDLQTWIRNEDLAPDWLRVGTDIVGGPVPPTFNAAFELNGAVAAPEPSSLLLLCLALPALLVVRRR